VLGVAPSTVAVVRGGRSRDKLVRVDGLDDVTLRRRAGLERGSDPDA
jgi:hypothetical protein